MNKQFTASEVLDYLFSIEERSSRQWLIAHDAELGMLRQFGDLLEAREKAVPVAWRTFDGEGNYDYRDYENNEHYRDWYVSRNGAKYANWVEPLYTHPSPSDAERLAEALRWIMRTAGDAKEPCGGDPESPAAIRNGVLASISQAAAQSLGIVQGPSLAARTPWTEGEKAHFKAAAELVAQREAAQAQPPAASVTKCDFTTDEVNECFDHLVDDGPRLIPIEAIQQMREHCLLAAQENPNG